MKNTINRVTMVLAVLAGATAGSSRAQDLGPPWRGQPGSARQEWRFDSAANPASPEVVVGPSTSAKAAVVSGQFGMGWQPSLPGMGVDRTGLWDLGRNGTITLMLNNPAANLERLSVQVGQWLDGSIYSDAVTVTVPGATADGADTGMSGGATVGGWFIEQTDWIVPAGAVIDRVVITGAYNGSIIDRIGVDTLSPVATGVTLNIRPLAGNNVEISWMAAGDIYALESTPDLSAGHVWEAVDGTVQVDGNLHSIAVNAGDASRFYRLQHR